MKINDKHIKTWGFFLVEVLGMDNLPGRKPILTEDGLVEKDVIKNAKVITVKICGGYATAAAVKSAISGVYAEFYSQPVTFEFVNYVVTIDGYVVDGASVTVETTTGKIVVWITFKIRV